MLFIFESKQSLFLSLFFNFNLRKLRVTPNKKFLFIANKI